MKPLLMARGICRLYDTKTAATDSIVGAVSKLHIVNCGNLNADYEGYDGPANCGPVDEDTTKKGLATKRIAPDSRGDLEKMLHHWTAG